MISKIIKRDGRIIDFDCNRIKNAIWKAFNSVDIACDDAKLDDILQRVMNEVESSFESEIPSVEDVQDIIVRTLAKDGESEVVKSYVDYRSERSRVRDSKSRLMKSIEEITFSDSKNADIKRENANINGNTAMGTMLEYGSAVSKEFCKTHVMNPVFSKAHDEGDIHIHDMDFMNMGTLTCCQIDTRKLFKGGFSTGHGFLREPQSIMSYSALAAIAIQSDQNDQHGGQSIPFFDYCMAEGVAKTFRREYVSKLEEAVELNGGNPDGVRNIVSKSEADTGKALRMEDSQARIEREKELLSEMYGIDIVRCQEFARKHAVKETERQTYQAMEALIHNLNTMHSRAGAQVPFSSLNFGTDISEEGRMVSRNLLLACEAGLGNGETSIFPILIFKVKDGVNFNPGDPNYDLLELSCRVTSKRLFPNFEFLDAPFNAQYLKKLPDGTYDPDSEVATMGCRTRVMGNVNGPETASGRGNDSFTTINLPRLGIKHGLPSGKTDLDAFFKDLDEKISLCVEQLLERLKIQGMKRVKNFPFLMGQGIWNGSENLSSEDTLDEVIKQGTLTVGFIGLAECLKALIGKHHGESDEAQELGLRIISFMRKRMDEATEKYHLNFSLIGTPAEGLSGRFTRIDAKQFGKIEGITDREYYTNSFHVPVYYPISVFDKIMKEAPYHALTNGGHISYVELDGNARNNPEAFMAIVRAMKESGIGYGSVNHPVDRDPVCGYSGIIPDHVCPHCGRNELDDGIPFDRIRRITGYLVGTLERFNDAKRAEVRDRVKHSV